MSGRFVAHRTRLRAAGAAALAFATLVLNCVASQDGASTGQLRGAPREVVFTHYSPLFSNAQIVRRLLSPLARAAVRDELDHSHEALSPYPLDLAKERFLAYVPSALPPSAGFALLVWVSPSDDVHLPFGWALQLNRYRVIFVAPEHAGNPEAVLGRRVPLALAAEQNIVRQYPIDGSRIYVGGFSGGSRVAERIALAYPDVFHGALLDAGSDPLGTPDPWAGVDTLPPRNLFRRFQSSSHLVYVSGELDPDNLASDATSSQSMRDRCVFGVETHETPCAGHEIMNAEAFGRALERLLSQHRPPDPAQLGACRSHLEAEIEGRLGQAQALISRGRHAAARTLLLKVDQRYGGLASPRILELARQCRCGLAHFDKRNPFPRAAPRGGSGDAGLSMAPFPGRTSGALPLRPRTRASASGAAR